MRLVYSRHALADLKKIAAYYATAASPTISDAIGRRLTEVIDRICLVPLAAPRVSQRSGVRVVSVVRYPFRIFYRVSAGDVEILRVRHTSRQQPKIT
jgi:plasmid stabilization system protein ParE